ncbi:hypothetical protein QR680_005444 [Steinernema hermaphroditum]|uniref:RRM domain-containing protein n=1 Tax=Steinernema hermaphroditum TaxID=289476 RepID=A0AA39LVP4_9BILA|nr:hypothetical protein QR680_005444 [Steinernema hermaphroditum]
MSKDKTKCQNSVFAFWLNLDDRKDDDKGQARSAADVPRQLRTLQKLRMRLSAVRWLAKAAFSAPSQQHQTVYLTHVKWITGKNQVEKYFSRFGQVKDVSLFFDPETGLHRGFASVTFAKAESATAAVQNKPHVIDGDLVGIEFYMPLKTNQKFKML